ncbi:hypothetical protein B9Z55_008935 [Caenorhabditis nigoni]|uniref:Uncharacterized protein n=1 Tax=Caenorhabditis nigoni TaxID=1611254 RepID=A0A2G5UPW3_9PELO|nr:hypothetical protein B9Z55_008935 [Caenorhabditis nigoni]
MTDQIVKCHWYFPIDLKTHSVHFTQNMRTGKSDLMVDKKIGKTTVKILYEPRTGKKKGVYVLEIAGKRFREFCDAQNHRFDRWEIKEKDETFHVVLDKTQLDIYVNGEKVDSDHKDEGQVTITFKIEMANGTKLNCRSHPELGKNGTGITHSLFINNDTIPVPLIVDHNTGEFPATDVHGFLRR